MCFLAIISSSFSPPNKSKYPQSPNQVLHKQTIYHLISFCLQHPTAKLLASPLKLRSLRYWHLQGSYMNYLRINHYHCFVILCIFSPCLQSQLNCTIVLLTQLHPFSQFQKLKFFSS
jgi:hypothetical protein